MGLVTAPFQPFTRKAQVDGLSGFWPMIAYNQTALVTIANTVAETSGVDTTNAIGTNSIPANYLLAGTLIRIRMDGSIQTDVAAPTLQIRTFLGGSAILDTTAVLTAASLGTVYFETESLLTVKTIGAGGTMQGTGVAWSSSSTYVGTFSPMVTAAAVNTTVANALDIRFTWGTANAANSLRISNCYIELIG